MSELQSVARLKIHDGKLYEFKRLAAKCAELVRTKDTSTLKEREAQRTAPTAQPELSIHDVNLRAGRLRLLRAPAIERASRVIVESLPRGN